MPKETGIIMSGSHPVAIIKSRKTMTRRVIKPQPEPLRIESEQWLWRGIPYLDESVLRRRLPELCPYGGVGDRLWVKETWMAHKDYNCLKPSEIPNLSPLWYWADGNHYADKVAQGAGKVRPSIFLPKWASRILLEITELSVEKLNQISGQDIKAEGLDVQFTIPGAFDALERFSVLWDSLNSKKYPWNSYPWVWCISFRRMQ